MPPKVVNGKRDELIFRLHKQEHWRDPEIAELVGITANAVNNVIRRQRMKAGMPTRPSGAPQKFTDAELDGAHCERCGLRGEHECVPPLWSFAARRTGHFSDELERPGFIASGGKGS